MKARNLVTEFTALYGRRYRGHTSAENLRNGSKFVTPRFTSDIKL